MLCFFSRLKIHFQKTFFVKIQKNTFSLELTTGQRGKACAHNSRPNQEIAEHAVNRKESNRE